MEIPHLAHHGDFFIGPSPEETSLSTGTRIVKADVCLNALKDSQEFLLLLLNELHEELRRVQWNDAAGCQRPRVDGQVDQSLSDTECISTRGVDVMSLVDDDSSCHSSTSADDVFCVCALISTNF